MKINLLCIIIITTTFNSLHSMEDQRLIHIQQSVFQSSYQSLPKNKNIVAQTLIDTKNPNFTIKRNNPVELKEKEYTSILMDDDSDTDTQYNQNTYPNNLLTETKWNNKPKVDCCTQKRIGELYDKYFIGIIVTGITTFGLALPYIISVAMPVSNHSKNLSITNSI